MAAFVASWFGDGHFSFVAPRTLIGVEKQFALVTHHDAAMRTRRILKLEIPGLPAVGATIMRDNLDAVINDVPLRR
jgi:hypothetical protein